MVVKYKRIIPLTPKQKAIIDFVSQFSEQKGYAPSLEEIARHFNLKALSTIHQHIEVIRKKGYLQKDDFRQRSVSTLVREPSFVEVPLLGRIAAGDPIEPIENPEPVLVPKDMVRDPKNYYALKVKGDSMIEDDVWDGDVILIKHQQIANIGDMVVAVVNGDVTLKRFGGLVDGKIKLIPRNPRLTPMLVNKDTFEIRGKFAGLIRR